LTKKVEYDIIQVKKEKRFANKKIRKEEECQKLGEMRGIRQRGGGWPPTTASWTDYFSKKRCRAVPGAVSRPGRIIIRPREWILELGAGAPSGIGLFHVDQKGEGWIHILPSLALPLFIQSRDWVFLF
jgi:hypothetical protein